jgi:hypothetical protein
VAARPRSRLIGTSKILFRALLSLAERTEQC